MRSDLYFTSWATVVWNEIFVVRSGLVCFWIVPGFVSQLHWRSLPPVSLSQAISILVAQLLATYLPPPKLASVPWSLCLARWNLWAVVTPSWWVPVLLSVKIRSALFEAYLASLVPSNNHLLVGAFRKYPKLFIETLKCFSCLDPQCHSSAWRAWAVLTTGLLSFQLCPGRFTSPSQGASWSQVSVAIKLSPYFCCFKVTNYFT